MKTSILNILIPLLLSIMIDGLSQDAEPSFSNLLTDSLDQRMDMSDWLMSQSGFLPVPSIITEPATGFGLAAGLLFIEPFSRFSNKTIGQAIAEKGSPPDMGGAFGFGTQNGSWGAGLFYKGYWKQDTWRYFGAMAKLSVNLDLYQVGSRPLQNPITFNFDGVPFVQEVDYRIASRLFAGLRYLYFNFNLSADREEGSGIISQFEYDVTLSGLGMTLFYDTRNNTFTPTGGFLTKVFHNRFEKVIGSDVEFNLSEMYLLFYYPLLADRLLMGLRFDGRTSSDSTPFYVLPYIDMRGIPIMRYQGKNTMVLETEMTYMLDSRWGINVFAGAGKAFPDLESFSEEDFRVSGGAGFRYLLARKLGMYGGIDVAHGPENWAIYLTFGSAWGRY